MTTKSRAHHNPPAHRFDESLADRQPKPGPRATLIPIPYAIEHVEHALALGGRYAGSLVSHTDHKVLAQHVGADLDSRTGRRELGGVVQDIDDHLLQKRAVRIDDFRVRRHSHIELMFMKRLFEA